MTQPYQTLADLLIARAEIGAAETAFRSWSRGHAHDRLSCAELLDGARDPAGRTFRDVQAGQIMAFSPEIVRELLGRLRLGLAPCPGPREVLKWLERPQRRRGALRQMLMDPRRRFSWLGLML